ncbi:MAG: hypothetical protein AB7O37_00660 [Vicinamibacteria bacterium]
MTKGWTFRTQRVLLCALLCATPSAAQAPDALDPFPLAQGTYWVYRETYAERLGGIDALEEEETRFEVRGTRSRPFLLQTGGFDPASGPVERGAGFIRLAPWTGEDALPLPLEPGRAGPVTSPDGAPWRVEAEEEIEAPAGRFLTLRVALRGPGTHSVLWIAPGLGVVRETQGPPGQRPELERMLLRSSLLAAAGGR